MPQSLKNYALVTIGYWGFTLTDGALRMMVLLHFYTIGYSPFEIASLFLLYEFFGVVTNLIGGWVASRVGLKVTLFVGLLVQTVALLGLAQFDAKWSVSFGVVFVMGMQAMSGIAKDLTKMSAKTSVKILLPQDEKNTLFKWVAILTGSKNALKGLGFFMGGVLLTYLGFKAALWAMAGALGFVLILLVVGLPKGIGHAPVKTKFINILSKRDDINHLSAARFFLFGARDIWFVVGLPLFLTTQMSWNNDQVGTYMAAWVIGYGLVQAMAPKIMKNTTSALDGRLSCLWILILIGVTTSIALIVVADVYPGLVVVFGLLVFGFVFAINSAVHSYLILAYTPVDDAALNVGFYYMANAGGRLVGTMLSGLAFQYGGLEACLGASVIFLSAAWGVSLKLPFQTSLKHW